MSASTSSPSAGGLLHVLFSADMANEEIKFKTYHETVDGVSDLSHGPLLERLLPKLNKSGFNPTQMSIQEQEAMVRMFTEEDVSVLGEDLRIGKVQGFKTPEDMQDGMPKFNPVSTALVRR